MRYSAATCDPNDFKDAGFTLRQVMHNPPRRTELFIVMTTYNEDEELFCRTMHGVIKNVAHLCKRERSKTWGKEGWKKVVCIVSDGRGKINSRTLSVIAAMGVHQEGVAKTKIGKKDVTGLKSSSVSKKKIRKKSTFIGGSSTPLAPSSNPTSVSYTFALVGFAVITIYTTVAAFLLTSKSIALLVAENGGKALDLGDFVKNPIFRNIVLSLVATLGLYIFVT